MTPKEKAKELVDKFARIDGYQDSIDLSKCYYEKQCALIAIEEVFLAIGDDYFKKYEFYLEVKRQLEKL